MSDIKRFLAYLSTEIAFKDRRFIYAEGSFDGDDAQAFIDGVKGMAREFQSMHDKKCDCFYCTFARKILE